jgi:hypothetical protein
MMPLARRKRMQFTVLLQRYFVERLHYVAHCDVTVRRVFILLGLSANEIAKGDKMQI